MKSNCKLATHFSSYNLSVLSFVNTQLCRRNAKVKAAEATHFTVLELLLLSNGHASDEALFDLRDSLLKRKLTNYTVISFPTSSHFRNSDPLGHYSK